MLTVLVRTILLFFVAVVVIRVMDKRQVGQLQPFELVIAIMIADLATTPMGDVGTPLLYGVIPMLALLVLHSLICLISLKSEGFRRFMSGKPSVLIQKGKIQEKELRRICYNLNDLLEEIRSGGVLSPADVGTAILETSGKMSVFPKAEKRALSPADARLSVAYEGIPLTLVLDGQVQRENLRVGGLDEVWLGKSLSALGFKSAEEVLLASLDTQGMLFAQGRGEHARMRLGQVLAAEKVGW